MPRLVHLAPEHLERRIERSGLRGHPTAATVGGVSHDVAEGVYAMPVMQDFGATYQWLRELRRYRRGRLMAVHFVIPSDEVVFGGRFGAEKKHGPASEVIADVIARPTGAEVIIPRAIRVDEIRAITPMRQDVGWVQNPDTPHKYDCVCAFCLPAGTKNLKRRVRRAYEAALLHFAAARSSAERVSRLGYTSVALERGAHHLPVRPLLQLSRGDDEDVRRAAVQLLGYFPRRLVEARLIECLDDDALAPPAARSLADAAGVGEATRLVTLHAPHLRSALRHLIGPY